MYITNNLNFDNTLSVKLEAKKNNHLLNITKGRETQIYSVGNEVITTIHVADIPVRTTGKIVDAYNNNGYIRYVVTFIRLKNGCKRKTETINRNFKQSELKLI